MASNTSPTYKCLSCNQRYSLSWYDNYNNKEYCQDCYYELNECLVCNCKYVNDDYIYYYNTLYFCCEECQNVHKSDSQKNMY